MNNEPEAPQDETLIEVPIAEEEVESNEDDTSEDEDVDED